jgi:putative transcriptional regulator
MIKNKLKFYRELSTLSQTKFAMSLNINPGQYNKWENQKIQPSIESAWDICKKLNITLNDLFYDEEGN